VTTDADGDSDADADADADLIACPFEDCDAGPWPDTMGADGGRRQRVLHLLREHDDCRGHPMNRIERL